MKAVSIFQITMRNQEKRRPGSTFDGNQALLYILEPLFDYVNINNLHMYSLSYDYRYFNVLCVCLGTESIKDKHVSFLLVCGGCVFHPKCNQKSVGM